MSGKRYPEEFKIEAVKQVVDCAHSISDVAKRLDVTSHSLYAWVKKYGPDSKQHNELSDAQAEADLQRIWLRGLEEFGEAQADVYFYKFFARFEQLAEQPYLAPAVDEIRQGYRRAVCGVDLIN